jgi:hypothetical protein
VFHHQELLVVLGEMITNFRQYRMPKAREHPSLPLERITEQLVPGEKCSLDRYRATQSLVHGKVNLAHPSFPDQLNDQITALDQRILG